VRGEAVHQEVEGARDEHDLVTLFAAPLDEVARSRIDGPPHGGLEGVVGQNIEAIARDSLVHGEEELVEAPPVDHLGEGHPGRSGRRPGQREDAPQRIRLVREVKGRRMQQIGADERAVDVEETGGHDTPALS
jgi:hypothetical protein